MPLWPLLEDRACWAGHRVEWERWLGDSLLHVDRWLRPREELSMSVPTRAGAWRRVVVHADDDAVAIDDETDAVVAINAEDRVVHELDGDALVQATATALGLDGAIERVAHRSWALGHFIPIAGARFPVFMAATRSRDELRSLSGLVASRTSAPFVLATPTDRWVCEGVRSLLRDRGSAHIALDRAMVLSGDGLTMDAPLPTVLSTFLAKHVPAASFPERTSRFPTPAGADWCEVSIRFIDGHFATLTIRDVTRRCSYEDLGLVHKTARTPTKLWTLLRMFAIEGGTFDWKSPKTGREIQKQRERLADALCAYFGIEGDPFAYDDRLKGWRARFTIAHD